jgi:hypothetical protein
MDAEWLIFLICIIAPLWFIVPFMAHAKGRSDAGWLMLSLIISPILCIILLAILGDTNSKRHEKLLEDEQMRTLIRRQYEQPQPPFEQARPTNPTGRTINDQYRDDHERYVPK